MSYNAIVTVFVGSIAFAIGFLGLGPSKRKGKVDWILNSGLMIGGSLLVTLVIANNWDKIPNSSSKPTATAVVIPDIVTREYFHRTGTVLTNGRVVAGGVVYLVVRPDEKSGFRDELVGAYASATHGMGQPWLTGDRVSIVLLRCELSDQRIGEGTNWFVEKLLP